MDNIEYKNTTISGMNIEYRKWKVKDKIRLDAVELDLSLSEKEKKLKKRQIFVYDCLKEPVILDIEQYNYVLSLIREYSLHSDIEFSFHCNNCDHDFDVKLSTPEIITFKPEKYEDIEIHGKKLKIGNVKNKDYDRDVLFAETSSERYLIDLSYHILEIDGVEAQPSDVFDFLTNLDVDDFQVLFNKYDACKCKCILDQNVKCPHCGHIDSYSFDETANFFPESWSM